MSNPRNNENYHYLKSQKKIWVKIIMKINKFLRLISTLVNVIIFEY